MFIQKIYFLVIFGKKILQSLKKCACMLIHFSHVQLFVTLWAVTHQAPLSKGFSRQEY